MKVGDLVTPRRDNYVGYVGPGTLALVVDIARYASVTNVLILVDGRSIWVSRTMLEVVDEAG